MTPRSILIATHVEPDAARTIGEIVNNQIAELTRQGYVIVPKRLSAEMELAGRLAMPVEYCYWQENRMLRAELKPHRDCVPVQSVFDAILEAAPK
jgi:hypothetical protein